HILLILPILLALTIHLVLTETFAQQGSMATLQNIDATYAVSIVPGAAQKENISLLSSTNSSSYRHYCRLV
ncbi:MAG: hypothetical protein ACXW1A_04445, partial [Nitrososphaeraceae archaeon]